jgi:hypothetical protein
VASYFSGEPFQVLGLTANADADLARQAADALRTELSARPRLAERARWAVDNWGRAMTAKAPPRPAPLLRQTRARSRTQERQPVQPRPATPGKPEGLVGHIDMGQIPWESTVAREVRLTWKQFAPYSITAEVNAPVFATVTASKALPGRFVVTLGIDWASDELRKNIATRGYTLDATLTVRWPGDEARIPVRGILLYPAIVSASPLELDLGQVRLNQPVQASLVLVSTGSTSVEVAPTPWLKRVDAAGKALDEPIRLRTNTPVRVGFAVQWPPIVERLGKVAAGKPVRPSGTIVVRWDGNELTVPVQMVVAR